MAAKRIQARKEKLYIWEGEKYKHVFQYVDDDGNAVDISGYSGRMQIRRTADDDTVLYDSDDKSDITVNGPQGQVVLAIPASVTAGWSFSYGVYDLELTKDTDSDDVIKIVWGDVQVKPEVTR